MNEPKPYQSVPMVRFVLWYGLGAKSQKNRTKPYRVSIDTRIWYDSGAEDLKNEPYISRSALKEYLDKQDIAKATVQKMLNPSESSRFIGKLINSNILRSEGHGWVVNDKLMAQSMMIMRGVE